MECHGQVKQAKRQLLRNHCKSSQSCRKKQWWNAVSQKKEKRVDEEYRKKDQVDDREGAVEKV